MPPDTPGTNVPWVSPLLGHANPEITLRTDEPVVPDEPTDLALLDFGGTKRHPDGTTTKRAADDATRDPASDRKRKVYLERETGFEPATLSLGSRHRRKR